MKKKLTGKIYRPVVWITGASRGIGKEIAKQFASYGYVICLSARNVRELRQVAREIETLGGRGHVFPMNIAKFSSIRAVHRKIKKNIGDVDILVNNAGQTSFRSFLETRPDSIHTIIQTNLVGPILLLREILPGMVKRRKGTIFNIISMVARKTYEGSSIYTASKAGLYGLGKVLREELRNHGVKVINIIPGATATDIWHPKVRQKHGWRMMRAKSVAETVLATYHMPDDVVVEEVVVRPILGDIE